MSEKIKGPEHFEVKKRYSNEMIQKLVVGLFHTAQMDKDDKNKPAPLLESIKLIIDDKDSDYLYDYIMEALDKDMANRFAPDVQYAVTRLKSFME
jgi:hypothetical protein